MRKAFTLVELLVVIGIIGILSAILLGTFSGSTEAAKAAQCLTNLKNLGMAVQNYAMQVGSFPPAQSTEYSQADISRGIANAKLKYFEHVGWISWYSKGVYPSESSQETSCREISMYSTVIDDYEYALKHGALYKQVGGNASIYVCPTHAKKKGHVNWSYLMNPKAGGHALGSKFSFKDGETTRTVSPDRVLLFCEVPFQGLGDWFPEGEGSNDATDAVLQSETENIGCNHKSGKFYVAHTAFADGHVEKLRVSSGKASMSGPDLKELTKWLCEGRDVTFNGTKYEKVDGQD